MLRNMLIGMIVGIIIEFGARALGLWTYRQPQTPILNVVGVFGFVMGGLVAAARTIGLLPACGLALAFGLAYEVANLRLLHWWDFPNRRMGVVRGHVAIVAVLSVLWGCVPVVIVTAQALPRALTAALGPRRSRLEALNLREQQLLKKLQAVRRRERYVETKLDDVRLRKQAILDRRAARNPRKLRFATPSTR